MKKLSIALLIVLLTGGCNFPIVTPTPHRPVPPVPTQPVEPQPPCIYTPGLPPACY